MSPCRRIHDTFEIVGNLGLFIASLAAEIIREEIALRCTTMPSRFYGERP